MLDVEFSWWPVVELIITSNPVGIGLKGRTAIMAEFAHHTEASVREPEQGWFGSVFVVLFSL